MEYVTYILIILLIMGLCVLVFRNKADEFGTLRQRRRNSGTNERTPSSDDRVMRAEARTNVPTPWGWPGNHTSERVAGDRNVGGSLHRFVDHLISEKQTVENEDYLLQRNAKLKLLVEDRFGRSQNGGARSTTDEAVKDPAKAKPPLPVAGNQAGRNSLQDLKTPWGW